MPMPSVGSKTLRRVRQPGRLLGFSLTLLAITSGLFWAAGRLTAQESEEIPFYKHTIDLGQSEAAEVADVNRDGRLDIISGDNWYEQIAPGKDGPRWIKHHFRDLGFAPPYVEDLGDLAIDVNGDGYPDVVTSSYWSSPLSWWENPGKANKPWVKHDIMKGSPVEFSFLVDILNTGKPQQLLPQFGDSKYPLTWYEIEGKGEDAHWVGHAISNQSYGHGIGAGDVNGDGRTDIITPKGWFEAPPDPRTGQWIWHPDFDLGETGFIYAVDVNGDGRKDLVASSAHDYGIFWMEQGADSHWTKHMIDDTWSQSHALTMVDINRDGKPDFLTGKRYMAHDHDPGAREPLGIYWYEFLVEQGKVAWVKHVIDYSSRTGAGMHIPVADLYGDGGLDFAVAGKNGLFLFENRPGAR